MEECSHTIAQHLFGDGAVEPADLRAALDRRLAAGDRLVFSGDDQMKSELLLVL